MRGAPPATDQTLTWLPSLDESDDAKRSADGSAARSSGVCALRGSGISNGPPAASPGVAPCARARNATPPGIRLGAAAELASIAKVPRPTKVITGSRGAGASGLQLPYARRRRWKPK
jgi:hypothetical protein